MEPIDVLVISVVLIVVSARFSGRVGVAVPLVLLAVGIGVGYIPGLPDMGLEPSIVLDGILPLLLYATAWKMSVVDFRREMLPVVVLAILLVAFTAFVAGAILCLFVPDLSFAWGVAFGAVISPTDAVAVAIARKTGVSSRVITMLEGEGLLNDATALVTLATAINIAMSAGPGAGNPARVAGSFLFSVVVAVAIGLAAGYLSTLVRARLHDPATDTTFSLTVPFIASIPANHLGASGLVAAVVAGLLAGNRGLRAIPARNRLNSEHTWATMSFVLESAIFLAMGMQIPGIIDSVGASELGLVRAFGIATLLGFVVVVCRAIVVVPLLSSLHWRRQRLWKRAKSIDRETLRNPGRFARWEADLDFFCDESMGPREATILIWGGMRGAVTLAAAQTLPIATPHRSALILVAVLVAGGSLVIQGLTLNGMIRLVKPRMAGNPDQAEQQEIQSLLAQVRAETSQLPSFAAMTQHYVHGDTPRELTAGVITDRRGEGLAGAAEEVSAQVQPNAGGQPNLEAEPTPAPAADAVTAAALPRDLMFEAASLSARKRETFIADNIAVLEAQRAMILDVRLKGVYSTQTITRVLNTLDRRAVALLSLSDTNKDASEE